MKRMIVSTTYVSDEIKREFFQKLDELDRPVEEVLGRDKEDLFQDLYDHIENWIDQGYPIGEIEPGTLELEYTLPWYAGTDVLRAYFICTGVPEKRSWQGKEWALDFRPAGWSPD